MAKEKIDIVLEKIGGLENDIKSLKEGQQRNYDLTQGNGASIQKNYDLIQGNGASIQKNYDLIQKQGIRLEQVASDVKAVAEGHGVLLNAIEGVRESVRELDGKVEETRDVVKETNRVLKEHIRQPAHAVS